MKQALEKLGIQAVNPGVFDGNWISVSRKAQGRTVFPVYSPINGEKLGDVVSPDERDYERVLNAAAENFTRWRDYPVPLRGELIRQVGVVLREHKQSLGELIVREVGKIRAEAEGEVQEMIDIADFAVGLSRQVQGAVLPSERFQHRMFEQWHPLGNVAVITAFNFPAAVWAWNAMIGAVCGNSILWKPSPLAPLTAIAITQLCSKVAKQHGFPGLFTLLCAPDSTLGQRIAADRRIPLVSATGSTPMGRQVGVAVAHRLGRSLLELGGNNAVIVLRDANLDLALQAVVFGAIGTAGQRCTSTRRLIIEQVIERTFIERLVKTYRRIRIGNPLKDGVTMGPLINAVAVEKYQAAIKRIRNEGGEILIGGRVLKGLPSNLYVAPTIVRASRHMSIVAEETFAPILYVLPVKNLEEAIAVNNESPYGLSSAIFTDSLRSAELFLSARGSDCGIANVNCGNSGAEIGGAFGGEKDTGGGREAGSDAWKAYMRRQTCVVNWSEKLPLAQGIEFNS